MTQTELDNITLKLKCCSARVANNISNNLLLGNCDDSEDLILLRGYIEAIEIYDLDNEEANCIDEVILNAFISRAINICNKTCNCN